MKKFTFNINENSYGVRIVSQENSTINLEVNGTSYIVKMKEEVKTTKTPILVRTASKAAPEPVKIKTASSGKISITAPIPGVILGIKVKVGDTVKEGDLLLVLEAMKMENNIISEKGGVVSAINVSVGQQVLQNEVMIELE